MRRIRPTKYIEVAPQSVRREQRYVWSVAHAVIWVAQYTLPRWLWPSSARTTYYPGCGWRTAGALAWSAASGHRTHQQRTDNWIVAQARRAVGRAVSFVRGNQRASARIVPRNLRNIRNSRTKCGSVAGIPISRIGTRKSIAEIRSA